MAGRRITVLRYVAVAALAGCVLMAGCGPARPATAPASASPVSASPAATLAVGALHRVTGTATYLGTVTGTGALIAITVQGKSARAYLCDGTPGRAVTWADWFTGPVRVGTLEASGQRRARLVARLGRAATGTVTLAGGRAWRFTAALAPPGGQAGLFEGAGRLRGLPYHAGRIVLPGGNQRGAAQFPTGPVGHQYPLGPI